MHTESVATAPIDLSGTQNGVPERFSPGEMHGQLIEAEHFARYRWASTIAGSRRVLDAGCGTGYGSAMLARAGAREVVGVDIAEGVLEAIRPDMPDGVCLEVADLRELPYDDASFDLVVCFEVIEHFEDPFPVLDQLVRVLTPDGVLLISSPNRNVYLPGNPHHYHEFLPDELASELGRRMRRVRLMRQHDYVAAAILSDERFTTSADEPFDDLPIYKLVDGDLDQETYTLALASNGPLPEMPTLAMLTSHVALQEWMQVSRAQDGALQAHRRHIRELDAKLADHDELERRLIEAEQDLARIPDLELELSESRTDLKHARAELEETRYHLTRCRRAHQAVLRSPSWQITTPLRVAKRMLRNKG